MTEDIAEEASEGYNTTCAPSPVYPGGAARLISFVRSIGASASSSGAKPVHQYLSYGQRPETMVAAAQPPSSLKRAPAPGCARSKDRLPYSPGLAPLPASPVRRSRDEPAAVIGAPSAGILLPPTRIASDESACTLEEAIALSRSGTPRDDTEGGIAGAARCGFTPHTVAIAPPSRSDSDVLGNVASPFRQHSDVLDEGARLLNEWLSIQEYSPFVRRSPGVKSNSPWAVGMAGVPELMYGPGCDAATAAAALVAVDAASNFAADSATHAAAKAVFNSGREGGSNYGSDCVCNSGSDTSSDGDLDGYEEDFLEEDIDEEETVDAVRQCSPGAFTPCTPSGYETPLTPGTHSDYETPSSAHQTPSGDPNRSGFHTPAEAISAGEWGLQRSVSPGQPLNSSMGQRQASAQSHADAISAGGWGVQVGVATARGMRPQMEDFVQIRILRVLGAELLYFGIFDGHNGPGAARAASRQLHKLLAQRLEWLATAKARGSSPGAEAREDETVEGCQAEAKARGSALRVDPVAHAAAGRGIPAGELIAKAGVRGGIPAGEDAEESSRDSGMTEGSSSGCGDLASCGNRPRNANTSNDGNGARGGMPAGEDVEESLRDSLATEGSSSTNENRPCCGKRPSSGKRPISGSGPVSGNRQGWIDHLLPEALYESFLLLDAWLKRHKLIAESRTSSPQASPAEGGTAQPLAGGPGGGSRPVSGKCVQGGTTALVAVIHSGVLHIASAGDSRGVLSRSNGACRLTTDHSPSLPAETERIEELGGGVVRGRVQGVLAVSRAMGDAELQPFVTPEPQVSMLLRRAGDRALLLASDGVWGVLPDAEACAFAAEQSCAQAAAEALISVANARGGRDNASAIVVRWTGAAM